MAVMKRFLYILLMAACLLILSGFVTNGPGAYEEQEPDNRIIGPPRLRNIHFIPLPFALHTEPDLRSPVIATLNPQAVFVTLLAEGGFGRISTNYGDGWVFLAGNRIFIPRTMGLFEYIGQEEYTALISPQRVILLDVYDSWRLIQTWQGPRWINLDFQPSTDALDALLRPFGNSIAVFYKNIETGFTYTHNPDRIFFSASVNKAQHALYIYHLAEQGLVDLDAFHTFTENDFWDGTGIIQHMEFGRRFTMQQLLTMSIRHSDNIAFRMLIRRYGLSGYLDFVREIGADYSLIRNITGSNINARDAGLWAYEIYQYITSDGEHAETFKTDLMNTNANLIRADYPIASKYGWATGAFHDMAIVFADSPYILIILSNMDEGAFSTFINISRRFQEFNRAYFD